jgi:AcrR family transcriptional regulator
MSMWCQEVGRETMSLDIALRDVAARAEVSVQTVLRHFGSREGLLSATLEFGDWVITVLGQEPAHPQMRRMTETGRAMHRRWNREPHPRARRRGAVLRRMGWPGSWR